MSYQMKNEQLEPDIQTHNYSDQQLQRQSLMKGARNGFVKKVYSILTMQLVFTVAFVSLSMTNPAFAEFQQNNWGLHVLSAIVAIVSMIVICCCREFSKQVPNNYILLAIFTIAESYSVSLFCTFYDAQSVMLAATATLAATGGLTLYACTTKSDFTQFAHYFYSFLWSFVCLTITLIVLRVLFGQWSWGQTFLSGLIACIYSVYLIIDTQLVMGNRRFSLSLDDYVLGAILIYVDIIAIFIEILRILGNKK